MILSNVNIGTGPSSGDGSPLRSAFSIINNNFQLITNNVNALTNSVSSVAGRTGNVILTVNDIVGFNPTNYPNAAIIGSWISANVSALVNSAPITLDTLRELADAINDDPGFAANVALSVSSANTKMRNYVDGQIIAANAGIVTANLGMKGYVDSGVYLPSYGGNIKLNEITFNDLSEQTTAWLGSEWRSDLEANLTVKPSWLSYYPGGSKNIFGTSFGFGATGMFFTGDANYPAYPIRTNFAFHQDEHIEITTTINFVHQGGDNSIAIFNSNVSPAFSFGANVTRIAFDSNFGTPVIGGLTTANTAPGPVFFAGNVYTVKFVYDRNATPSVTVSSFAGNTATGSPIDVRTLNEQLPLGLYTVGFDGDQDNVGQLTYFTDLSIKTYDNVVADDLEIQGQVTGNLIPSANVTYSLGNVSHQWKDLWVSNATIYLNSVPLSLGGDNTLLVNNVPVVTYVNGNLSVGGNVVSGGGAANTADITFANTSISAPNDSEITVDAKTAERIRAKLRLEPTSGDAYLEAWSGQNTRSDTTWATAVWENNMYGNPYMTFTGAFDLAFFVVETLQSSADPDTVSYSINGGPYIAWDGGSSADTSTGYVQIYTSGVSPNVSPTAITTLDWRYAYKSSIGVSNGSGAIQITGRNQYLQVDIDQYILVNSKGSIEFNNSNYGNNVDIELRSGDDILLQAKDKTTSDNEGGDILIYAGDGGDADAGDPAGTGGDIVIEAGIGGSPSAAYDGAEGGTLDLYGGAGGSADTGNNRAAKNGGRARLRAGSAGSNGGNVALGAVGGPVEITAGLTTLANTNGGTVTITSGQGGSNALAGNVVINTPSSDLGLGGTWTFDGNGQLTLPGNIISGNSHVNFVANSSGDGQGYSTIELVPDVDRFNSDQYIIVDPTAPGHIHIRAGGAQDNSSADLIFGGENSHVKVTAGSNPPIYVTVDNQNWLFGIDGVLQTPGGITLQGNIQFADNTIQTTAWTGSSYSNVQVASYLPTYTGNIAAGNVRVSSGYRFETGNVRITNDNSSVTLIPDTSANALAGVVIGGSGYLLAPNNARNITLNYNSVGGAVGLQGNVTVGTGGSGNLFVQGNIIARDITAGNIIATGTSGVIGFNSGGFVQQATSNATQVTSNTTSGNIQLMNINLGASAVHTVTFACNKLTTNDMLLVKHISGGVTTVYVDAYVVSDGLGVIWLRDITGQDTGNFTPMLKYAIIRAPSA